MPEVEAGRWCVWCVWLIVPGRRFGVLDSVHVEESSAVLRGAVLRGLRQDHKIEPMTMAAPAMNP